LREIPARRTRRLIRNHNVTAANGVPRLVRNTFAGDFAFADGTITPTDAPGFGASLDRRKLDRYAF